MKHLKIVSKITNRFNRHILGRSGQQSILKNYLSQLLQHTDNPMVIETGCIRSLTEGTDSTLTIAKTLNGKGSFYSFELEKKHINICKKLCGEYTSQINFVQGDSVENIKKLVNEKVLQRIDFAFFDSVNNGDHIWKEFVAVEKLFHEASIVVVDDVLWADKGRIIKPYLFKSKDWKTKVFNVENGLLVAVKNSNN